MQIFSSVAQIRIHNINADIFVYMRPACKLPFVFRFSYHRLQHWIRGEKRKHSELGEKVVKTKILNYFGIKDMIHSSLLFLNN